MRPLSLIAAVLDQAIFDALNIIAQIEGEKPTETRVDELGLTCHLTRAEHNVEGLLTRLGSIRDHIGRL